MLVRRSGSAATAVRVDAAPVVLAAVCGAGAVREELAECAWLTWRAELVNDYSPRMKSSALFQNNMVRSARFGDYDARGGDGGDADASGDDRTGQTGEQEARVVRAEQWLALFGDRSAFSRGLTIRITDRVLVNKVARYDAEHGTSRTNWAEIARGLNLHQGRGARLKTRHQELMKWLAAEIEARGLAA